MPTRHLGTSGHWRTQVGTVLQLAGHLKQCRDLIRGGLVGLRQHVRVDVERDRDDGMAEASRDHARVHPRSDRQGSLGVAQRVLAGSAAALN
jgi:hypothetical protein